MCQPIRFKNYIYFMCTPFANLYVLWTWFPHMVYHGDPTYISYLYDQMWLVGQEWYARLTRKLYHRKSLISFLYCLSPHSAGNSNHDWAAHTNYYSCKISHRSITFISRVGLNSNRLLIRTCGLVTTPCNALYY